MAWSGWLGMAIATLAACDPGTADVSVDAGDPGPGDPDASGPGPGDPDADVPGPGDPDAAPPAPGVDDLVALLQDCNAIGGKYATDSGDNADIDVCGGFGGTIAFWKSDFDIDCDGKRTDVCNEQTDGAYQPQTSATDSNGEFLDASQLPYFVIPLSSQRWNYADFDIDLGQVAAVVYDGKVEFAVFGDQGPNQIIGEGSYRLAQLLGIDPDPSTGGTAGPVYFVVFTGEDARVGKMEDHEEAVAIGMARMQALLEAN
jgi:hypothetical protein